MICLNEKRWFDGETREGLNEFDNESGEASGFAGTGGTGEVKTGSGIVKWGEVENLPELGVRKLSDVVGGVSWWDGSGYNGFYIGIGV